VYRALQFHKRTQNFFGTNDETFPPRSITHFGGFAPDFPHYISGKEFQKNEDLYLFMIWIHK
jgi:hypothetical protein